MGWAEQMVGRDGWESQQIAPKLRPNVFDGLGAKRGFGAAKSE